MLWLTATVGSFTALCAAGLRDQLVSVVNAELRGVGLEVIRRGRGTGGYR